MQRVGDLEWRQGRQRTLSTILVEIPLGKGKKNRCDVQVYIHGFSVILKIYHAKLYNRQLKTLLENDRDDVPHTAEIGENKSGDISKKKGRVKLEDLTRYTMVKRIW